jgi:hypothetical protein
MCGPVDGMYVCAYGDIYRKAAPRRPPPCPEVLLTGFDELSLRNMHIRMCEYVCVNLLMYGMHDLFVCMYVCMYVPRSAT